MENKTNIVEILKDKPQGTKLYDLLYNIDVELDIISSTDTETVVWCTSNYICHLSYSEFGTVRNCPNGLQILLPSNKMKDWSKFSWKKGDVLVSNDGGTEIIFDKWYDDTYTNFYGKHYLNSEDENNIKYKEAFLCTTERYSLEDKDSAQTYINTIEARLGGKLNRVTLEIENAQPEFKDGDILACISSRGCIYIFIFRCLSANLVSYYANKDAYNNLFFSNGFIQSNEYNIRYATEEEKQRLFDALSKEGKAWDAEKKQIVDLKPKVEFKPFDKVVVRDREDLVWFADLFSHIDKENNRFACVGNFWNVCLPYNEETAHLLGTTDEWKGGEQ